MQDANDAGSPARKAPRASGGRVAQVLRQLEARDQVSPAPPARPLRSASQTPAATPRQNTGRKRKAPPRPAAAAASGTASRSSSPSPSPAQLTFADVVAGRTTPAQSVPLLVSEVQKLTLELSKVMTFGERTYNQLQHERQTNELQLEHLLRHSKRNNLVVFGIPESMAYSLPAQLARHMQGVLFQTDPTFRAHHGEVSLPSGQVKTESAQAQGGAGRVDLCCCQAYCFPGLQ